MGLAGRWQLHPLHLYLVRSYLELEDLTLPLEGPIYGRTTQQVGEIAQRELPTMEQLGLVVNDEVQDDLADALGVLTKPYLWVDSVWFPDLGSDHQWRAVAVVTDENKIVLGVQTPGETERFGGMLTVEVHQNVSLPQVFLPTLPPAPPGNHSAAQVPASAFQAHHPADDEGERSFMESATRRRGTSVDRQLVGYQAIGDAPHVRGGQIAANLRDRYGKVRRSQILRWFDNAQPDGRYLDHNGTATTGEQLFMLTPADARIIGAKINDLVSSVR